MILGACSSAATPSTPTATPNTTAATPSMSAPALAGRTFLSTDVKGLTLVPDTRVSLTFRDGGSLQASAGCNSMGGTYTIHGDRLTITQLSTTEMGCDAPRMKQDHWLAGFLADVSVALAGDILTMGDSTVQVTFLDKKVATPDRPIEGTRWILDGTVSGGAVSSVPAGVTASIQIVDGRVNLDTGCNTGGGTVAVTPGTLTFGPISLTKKACAPSAAGIETAVRAVLTGSVGYTINADVVTLDAGANGLILRATP